MNDFADAVNSGNLDDIHDCLHPDANDYGTANADYWDTYFGSDTGSGTFSASVNGTTATANWDGYTYTFLLKMEDTDYFSIYDIRRNGTVIFN